MNGKQGTEVEPVDGPVGCASQAAPVSTSGGAKRRAGQAGRDELWVALLAAGYKVAEVARRTQVNERTIRRRLDDPGFAARVHDARMGRARDLRARVTSSVDRALAALDEALDSGSPRERISAARTLLEGGSRLLARLQEEEFGQRIAALEGALEEVAAAANAQPTLGWARGTAGDRR